MGSDVDGPDEGIAPAPWDIYVNPPKLFHNEVTTIEVSWTLCVGIEYCSCSIFEFATVCQLIVTIKSLYMFLNRYLTLRLLNLVIAVVVLGPFLALTVMGKDG